MTTRKPAGEKLAQSLAAVAKSQPAEAKPAARKPRASQPKKTQPKTASSTARRRAVQATVARPAFQSSSRVWPD